MERHTPEEHSAPFVHVFPKSLPASSPPSGATASTSLVLASLVLASTEASATAFPETPPPHDAAITSTANALHAAPARLTTSPSQEPCAS
jgi:hypothetical protein